MANEQSQSAPVASDHLGAHLITKDACNSECSTSNSNKRAVFLDLTCFHRYWRSIPSNVISDCILIVPNVYTEWILRPSKYIKSHSIPDTVLPMVSDDVFIKLLQWKYHQGLLFCALNDIKTVLAWNLKQTQSDIAPFWHHLSNALHQLSYNPLILDCAYYTDIKSKFGVTPKQIVCELETLQTMSCDIMAEILFQSNPALNVITSFADLSEMMRKDSDNMEDKKAVFTPVPCAVSSALVETNDIDMDALLANIFEMYTVSAIADEEMMHLVNVSVKVEMNDAAAAADTGDVSCDEDGGQWWFAEDYETNYDCCQEITHAVAN